jgi:tryptophanyl-tRNA synthetase
METVVSGIRSTGNLHLGNYYGALQNFIKMQHEYNCFFFIADLHSLTTHPTPADLHGNVKQVLIEYLAAGIDPEKATIYVQSDVPEVVELYLYLNMNAYVGELEKSASFKDKIRLNKNNVNAGLLTYPVLMAADILIHKATKVPVGKDQEQHLEMARNFGNRFNHLYKTDYFPEPYAFSYSNNLIKVPGLDGQGKMGKSEGPNNAIFLRDTPEIIRKKVRKAVTETSTDTPDLSINALGEGLSAHSLIVQAKSFNSPRPVSPGVQNLFDLMKIVSTSATLLHFEEKYQNGTIRYGDLKNQLADDIILATNPIRERIDLLSNNPEYLRQVAELGAEKARESASATIKRVREIIGFKKF